MTVDTTPVADTIQVRSPSKLNLFLELLKRRDDGFHEIDTVMVAIDVCDDITIRRSDVPGVRLDIDWLPDRGTVAKSLDVAADADLLNVPTDDSNLISRAIRAMTDRFAISGGFEVRLRKRVPAGAGMGGASANAATTILAIDSLCDLRTEFRELQSIAAELGSDVPFFLGTSRDEAITAARCTGRGEIIEPLAVSGDLHFLVVFPNASLSTARVYSRSSVPVIAMDPQLLIDRLATGTVSETGEEFSNRLSPPACQIEPRIEEIHRSLWQSGLKAVQLTGSGSASFAMMSTRHDADVAALELRKQLQPGALVFAASTIKIPIATPCNVWTDA